MSDGILSAPLFEPQGRQLEVRGTPVLDAEYESVLQPARGLVPPIGQSRESQPLDERKAARRTRGRETSVDHFERLLERSVLQEEVAELLDDDAIGDAPIERVPENRNRLGPTTRLDERGT